MKTQVSINAGCNDYFGGYRIEGDLFPVGSFISMVK
ncbi:MAG: META domain-containing protein [Methanolinea sp.]|nr:MAG: META domain-containing protein [Methanolinea sp.]